MKKPSTEKLLKALAISASAHASDRASAADRPSAVPGAPLLTAAIGAVGVALTAPAAANAAVIVTPVNASFGYRSKSVIGGTSSFTFHSKNGESVFSTVLYNKSSNFGAQFVGVSPQATFKQELVRAGGQSSYQIFPAAPGKKWGSITGPNVASSNFASLVYQPVSTARLIDAPAGNNYYAFMFKSQSGNTDYGWFDATFAYASLGTAYARIGTVAYDDTGAQIAMGDLPEPPSAAILVLAAMVTGAAATRGFKRGKAAAA